VDVSHQGVHELSLLVGLVLDNAPDLVVLDFKVVCDLAICNFKVVGVPIPLIIVLRDTVSIVGGG
jgi:hypothetical protein